MTKNPFKAGDIVRLKTGGPAMCVYDVYAELVNCVWFTVVDRLEKDEPSYDSDKDEEPIWGPPQEFKFMASTLELVELTDRNRGDE